MPKINGKIYYNNVTGNVLLVVNQNEGAWLRETTFDDDLKVYSAFNGLNKEVISVEMLEWDQYKDNLSVSRPVAYVDGEFKWELFEQSEDRQVSLEEIQSQVLMNTEMLLIYSELGM